MREGTSKQEKGNMNERQTGICGFVCVCEREIRCVCMFFLGGFVFVCVCREGGVMCGCACGVWLYG